MSLEERMEFIEIFYDEEAFYSFTPETRKQQYEKLKKYLYSIPDMGYHMFEVLYENYYFIARPTSEEKEILEWLSQNQAYVNMYWNGERKAGDIMGNLKSKKFFYTWDDIEEGNKNAGTIIQDILESSELPEIEELVIGCWGECYDNPGQPIVDGIVEHKEKFQHIKSLFIGDMEFEECEVSWIEQADYAKLWEALPNLEKLTIKGSTDLKLGNVEHNNLQELEIICGGLPKEVIQSLANAKLPELVSLKLYIGVEDYGFDGDIEDIKALLANPFPKLKKLGLTDSEIQDEITAEVVKSTYMNQITELELSMGSLTDKGGAILLEEVPKHSNITILNLEYHYMSDEMMKKLSGLPIVVLLDEQQEEDDWDGEIYRVPMLTE